MVCSDTTLTVNTRSPSMNRDFSREKSMRERNFRIRWRKRIFFRTLCLREKRLKMFWNSNVIGYITINVIIVLFYVYVFLFFCFFRRESQPRNHTQKPITLRWSNIKLIFNRCSFYKQYNTQCGNFGLLCCVKCNNEEIL